MFFKLKSLQLSKLSLVFSIIFIIAIILGLVFIFWQKPKATSPPLDRSALLEQQYKEALKKDASACEKIKDAYYHNTCLYNFALKDAIAAKDPSICEKLKEISKENFENCQNNYYFQRAREELDSTLCSKLTDDSAQDVCKKEVKALKQLEEAKVK